MWTEGSKLSPSFRLEVLIHLPWKYLCICHIAPGVAEVESEHLWGEICFSLPTALTWCTQSACGGPGRGSGGLPSCTMFIVFLMHHLPGGISFTCMRMTQGDGRFKQCCCAFWFLLFSNFSHHSSVLVEEAVDRFLTTKKKSLFLSHRVDVCPPWWWCWMFPSVLAHFVPRTQALNPLIFTLTLGSMYHYLDSESYGAAEGYWRSHC